jgi:hypothetical protein
VNNAFIAKILVIAGEDDDETPSRGAPPEKRRITRLPRTAEVAREKENGSDRREQGGKVGCRKVIDVEVARVLKFHALLWPQ